MVTLSVMFQVSAGELTLDSGAKIAYNELKIEGDFVFVTIDRGTIKLKKSQLSEKDIKVLFESSENKAFISPAPTQNPQEAIVFPAPQKNDELAVNKDLVSSPSPIPSVEQAKKPVEREEQPGAEKSSFSIPVDWKKMSLSELEGSLADPESDLNVIEEELTLSGKPKSGMQGDKVVVYYRIAMKGDKKTPGPHADQLLFYAPYINDSEGAGGRENKDYTDRMGFTVFTFRITTNRGELSDPAKAYWMPEAGWYELVFEAAEKIRRKHNLKESKLFMWGNSSGAGMAERMALKYSDKFSAIALMGGSGYTPVDKTTSFPWLIMNTLGAGEQEDNVQLQDQLRKEGNEVIYAKTPSWRELRGTNNFSHTAGPLAISLLQNYFWSIYQKRESDGTMPSPRSWSLVAHAEKPFDIYRIPRGDLGVPLGDKWFRLPGEAMGLFWSLRPAPLTTDKIVLGEGQTIPLMVATPNLDGKPPKGVVIVTREFDYLQYATTVNDLYHWSEEGYTAVAFRSSKGTLFKSRTSPPWSELVDWIKKQNNLSNVPIYLSSQTGHTLPLEDWGRADLRAKLKAILVTEVDADEPLSKNKEQLEKYPSGVPILIAAHTDEDLKVTHEKKKGNEDGKTELLAREKRISQRFGTLLNNFEFYLVPPSQKNSEGRQTYAINRGIEFFEKSR